MDRSRSRRLGNAPSEGVGPVLNAWSPIKAKIEADDGDVLIVGIGDSTGALTTGFLYRWFEAVAEQYPTHTFEYYPSADPSGGSVTGEYGDVVTIATGSGSNTVRFYNNSISGMNTWALMGGLFDVAFEPGTPDLVLWNHGKNHYSGHSNPLVYPLVSGEILAAMAQVQAAFPDAQQVAIKQFPNRDDTGMDTISSVMDTIASVYPELHVVDLFTLSLVSGDYADNRHLNTTTGVDKATAKLLADWDRAAAGEWTPAEPWFDTKVANQVDGDSVNYVTRSQVYGDFNDNANGSTTPATWNVSGTITFSDETSIKYGAAAKSLKMQGSGSSLARILKGPTTARRAAMAGQWLTLTALVYVPSGADNTCGRISLSYTSPTTNGGSAVNLTTRATPYSRDGWHFQSIGPVFIPADVSAMVFSAYHDTDSTPDSDPVYLQKIVAAISQVPRDTL